MACRGIARRYAPGTCGGCGSSAHFRNCSSSCGGGCAPEASAVICHKLDILRSRRVYLRGDHQARQSVSAELRNTERAIDQRAQNSAAEHFLQ